MSSLTKRRLLTLASAITVGGAASRAAAQDLPAHERQLYEAARREGEITWYSGQYNAETSEAVGRAFNERYPGVRCNVVRSTSQVAFQRLSQDARARVGQCDVFSSTNSGHFTQLKREGRLIQFKPENASGHAAGDPECGPRRLLPHELPRPLLDDAQHASGERGRGAGELA